MSELAPRTPPPGWYPDPSGLQRWWDGSAWGVYAPAQAARPAKDTGVAYLLAIFLGGFGAHHFYLGHTAQAVVVLCLWLFGWATSWLLIGFVPLTAVVVWFVVDLFLIPGYVRAANARAFAGGYR
jgi:TM2 domain-containing membrane protein YozV